MQLRANIQNCKECHAGSLMKDMKTVGRKLEMLDIMHRESRARRQEDHHEEAAQKISKKMRELTRKVAHYSRQIESNSREAEDLVTQTKLMMQLRCSQKQDLASHLLASSSSPSLLSPVSTPNNFSSVESLQRYISQGDSLQTQQNHLH